MDKRPYNKLIPVPFEQVEITDDFWSKRQKTIREKSIHSQHEKLEEYRHIDNFRIASGTKEGIFRGVFFFDSDLYKWLEAACMILQNHKDEELEKKVNEIVGLISKTQEDNGYLNTYYSIMFPNKKFSNLLIMHELYCMGHFFEAAVAHKKATGTEDLLKVASKCVDFLTKTFIQEKLEGAPGHQEIELALIALYRLTKEQKYLVLAKEFLERRGNIRDYRNWAWKAFRNTTKTLKEAKIKTKDYELEGSDRYLVDKYSPKVKFSHSVKGVFRMLREFLNGKYAQLDVPVRKATIPTGHAVRAMYLYSAMADLYSETGDEALFSALKAIWERMVEARMYITGGTGSIAKLEGFGRDFELDNFGSYSETCAAIGNMLWNWRMSQITANVKYAGLLERLMYNAMLVGPSIDGNTYMYNNPLASRGDDERREWYLVACCPPNIARTISSIGKFIYSDSEIGVWVHQYIGNTTKINNKLTLVMESNFPKDFNVSLLIKQNSSSKYALHLRIPSWAESTDIKINGVKIKEQISNGTYLELHKNWNDGDKIELSFHTEPILINGNPRVKNNRDRAAISYGPLIYCLEQIDNRNIDLFRAQFSKEPNFEVNYDSDLLGGINIIKGDLSSGKRFTAIPYYAWLNRGPNKMLVWNKLAMN